MASSTTTTTSNPTTTSTTLPPTTTTTTTLPPAIAVIGWEGEGIRQVSVTVEFDYPTWTADLEASVGDALRQIGVGVVGGSDAVLSFDLTGTARSASYSNLGTCYSGARITGTARLAAPGMTDLSVSIAGNVPTPILIFEADCQEAPEDAPFGAAFDPALIDVMTSLFGVGSVPYLIEVLSRPPVGDWSAMLATKSGALEAFRAFDRDAVSVEVTSGFLSAAIDTIFLIRGDPDEPIDDATRAYRDELRRVLLDYSETDFGFVDEESITAWEAWLADWVADRLADGD